MATLSPVHLVSVLRAAGFRATVVCDADDGTAWVVGPGFVCLPAGGSTWEWILPDGTHPPLTGLLRESADVDDLLAELAHRRHPAFAEDDLVESPRPRKQFVQTRQL